MASQGVFPPSPRVPSSTAASVATMAWTARRRGSITGHAASAISQPATAAGDHDSRPNITKTALDVSTTVMAAAGNLLMTAIGMVDSSPSMIAAIGARGPVCALRPRAASPRAAATRMGPVGRR